jgi:cyclopropane fatty-acyl-phospholipid synthase-like methyltransferase
LILENVSLKKDAKILDLACGAGRHSILFAQEGFNVTAVDLSKNLLSVAKRSAVEAGVDINFIRSDLRDFSITPKFDLAVNLFTSFGYFQSDEENYKMFKVAAEHLRESGYFVLDYLNKRYIENKLVPHSVEEIEGGKIIQERKIEGKRVIKTIKIRKNGSDSEFYESVRMYGIDELEDIFSESGFKIQNIFGGSEGKSFDLETSPRIIFIARR